jgi:hypothetical protein
VTVVILVIGAAVAAAVLGAFGGRWLTLRRLDHLDELRDATLANAQRSNIAASRAEKIADQWPFILSRWEQLEPNFVQALGRAADVERQVADVDRRMADLEGAIASNFSIELTGRRG